MAQIDRKPQHLSDIVPEDMFVGTSLILRRGDRFLYGPRPLQEEGARQVIELTGIGLPNLIWLAPAQILETARRDVQPSLDALWRILDSMRLDSTMQRQLYVPSTGELWLAFRLPGQSNRLRSPFKTSLRQLMTKVRDHSQASTD